jgi:hypothetical protein
MTAKKKHGDDSSGDMGFDLFGKRHVAIKTVSSCTRVSLGH